MVSCLLQQDTFHIYGNIFLSACSLSVNNSSSASGWHGNVCKNKFCLDVIAFVRPLFTLRQKPLLFSGWHAGSTDIPGRMMWIVCHLPCSPSKGHPLPWQLHKHQTSDPLKGRSGENIIYEDTGYYRWEETSLSAELLQGAAQWANVYSYIIARDTESPLAKPTVPLHECIWWYLKQSRRLMTV